MKATTLGRALRLAPALVCALLVPAEPQDAAAFEYWVTGAHELKATTSTGAHRIYIDGGSFSETGGWTQEILRGAYAWNAVRGAADMLSVRWVKPDVWLTKRKSRIRAKQMEDYAGYAWPRLNFATNEITRVRIAFDKRKSVLPVSTIACDADGDTNYKSVRNRAVHEFGHALNLGHTTYSTRQSLMRRTSKGGKPDGLYCGESDRIAPHADEAAGIRAIYPTVTRHRDIAPMAWVADHGSRPALPVEPAEGPSEVCAGDVVNQEWSIMNRGNEKVVYTRKWWLSDDRELGGDQLLLTETNRAKASGAAHGEYSDITPLSLPQSVTSWPNRIILSVQDGAQSPGASSANDWTYFDSRYTEAGNCP